jgi:hypothetical protein
MVRKNPAAVALGRRGGKVSSPAKRRAARLNAQKAGRKPKFQISDAVARRDQVRVVIDGLTAANDLGLTTAVPARVTVLTDARLRPVTLGRQVIRFRAAAGELT